MRLSAIIGMLVGCGPSSERESPQSVGQISSRLTISGPDADVAGVSVAVVGAGQDCDAPPIAFSSPQLQQLELGEIAGSEVQAEAFSDAFFVLSPGRYRVCATPLGPDGGPSEVCRPTDAPALVVAGGTTEVILSSQCNGDPPGALDALIVFNEAPSLRDLDIAPSKIVPLCQEVTLTATADDADGQDLSFQWTVAAQPDGSSPVLDGDGDTVVFTTDTAGNYELRVSVGDGYGGSTSLTFPLYVRDGGEEACAPQGGGEVSCVQPTDADPGQVLEIGDTIPSDTATVEVQPLGSGEFTEFGNVTVTDDMDGAQAFATDGATIAVAWDCAVDGMTLRLRESDGASYLMVNGDDRYFIDIGSLSGASVGGVTVGVSDLGGGEYDLVLGGVIYDVKIGGQSLDILSMCPGQCANLQTVTLPLTIGDEFATLEEILWEGPIPVCWENPSPSDAPQRAQVQAIVQAEWESQTCLRTTGWGPCAADADGIRIRIADENPRTLGLGAQLDGVPGGMVLNFTYSDWCPQCAANYDNSVESNALHEFGHAFGATHEHNRDDCLFDVGGVLCEDEPQGPIGLWNVTRCDAASIMNYCFDASYSGAVSALDLAGMQAVYGTCSGLATEQLTFSPQPTGTLCPIGPDAGDAEFAGNGPEIGMTVQLLISLDQRHLEALIEYQATEIGGDTEVDEVFLVEVYEAPPGQRILSIDSGSFSFIRGVSGGGGYEPSPLECREGPLVPNVLIAGDLVRRADLVGDTSGSDVSSDSDCTCDTKIENIEFDDVTITLGVL